MGKSRRFVAAAALFALAASVNAASEKAGKALEQDSAKKAAVQSKAVSNPVSLAGMARMYYNGQGVAVDYAKALYLYRQAALQGHAASMIAVGAMYENGLGTSPDYAAAMQWYRKAAGQGYASAQQSVGDLYRLGKGVRKDEAEAARWYEKAANQQFAEAQCRLGYQYLRGRGVVTDSVRAKALLEAGAKQGNACSQHYLAFMYMNALVSALPDTQKALELDRLAAGNGDMEAQYNVAKAHEIGWIQYATQAEALNWYRHSANQGYPPAMERLADVYEKGELQQTVDPEKADKWRKRAKAAWQIWPEPRPASMDGVRFMPLK